MDKLKVLKGDFYKQNSSIIDGYVTLTSRRCRLWGEKINLYRDVRLIEELTQEDQKRLEKTLEQENDGIFIVGALGYIGLSIILGVIGFIKGFFKEVLSTNEMEHTVAIILNDGRQIYARIGSEVYDKLLSANTRSRNNP